MPDKRGEGMVGDRELLRSLGQQWGMDGDGDGPSTRSRGHGRGPRPPQDRDSNISPVIWLPTLRRFESCLSTTEG